ncbi:TonB-dependent siderophore receptor [Lampropedia puyangensis]|nr:TonB-dependent siderophore receptor [Lampropedia puyangensis]
MGAFTNALAQASDAHYNLPAQHIERTLDAITTQSHVPMQLATPLESTHQAPAINGTLSALEAVRAALAGSNLEAIEHNGSIVIQAKPRAPQSQAEAGALPEVVVTAQGLGGANEQGLVATRAVGATKTDTALVETPVSISVVTREQMDQMGAQSVQDSLSYLAGVDIGTNGTDSRVDEIWVRGFRTGSFANNLYLDGLRPPGSSSGASALSTRFDSYGVERVEVVRGPISTLYGQVAPGGVVNMRSKRPPETTQRQVGLQTDNWGLIRANMDFGGPLNEDKTLLYRLVSSASHTGTQVDHVDLNRIFVNPSLTWQPSARTSLTVLGNYQQDRGGATYQFLPSAGIATASPYGTVPTSRFLGEPDYNRYDRNQTALGYSFEQFFGDAGVLRQNVRYIKVDMISDGAGRRTLGADGRTMTGTASSNKNKSDGISIDTNVAYTIETGPFVQSLLAGFDYQKTDIHLDSASGTVGPIDLFEPVYGQPVVIGERKPSQETGRYQHGLYLQDQLFWEKWTLTAGLRHDWAKDKVVNLTRNTRTDNRNEATTGRVGVTYLFDNGVAPFANYSTSFQPSSGEDYFGKRFDPVLGKQAEMGVKYQPAGSSNLITASVYEITQSNISTPDPDPEHLCNGGQCYVQTGEGRVRGLELEGVYAVTPTVTTSGSFTYQNTKVTESNSTDLGKRLARVPDQIITLRGDWRAAPGLSLGLGARYTGSSYGNTTNTWKNDSKTIWDASLRYDLGQLDAQWKGMKFSLNAANLFDKVTVACTGASSCFYGARRTVSANLTYDW